MNPETEDFEQLRRLLVLKRHEVPPPGYFNRLSDQIVARLHGPEPLEPLTWWERFGLDFDLKPALVCGLGVLVCGLLAAGVIAGTQLGETASLAGNIEAPPLLDPTGSVPASMASFALIPKPEEVSDSTSPLIRGGSPSSPFGQQLSQGATRAAFGFGSANN